MGLHSLNAGITEGELANARMPTAKHIVGGIGAALRGVGDHWRIGALCQPEARDLDAWCAIPTGDMTWIAGGIFPFLAKSVSKKLGVA